MLGRLWPRHLDLISLINHFRVEKLKAFYRENWDKIRVMSLIEEGDQEMARMANFSIIGFHKINGVAELHTEILKAKIFRDIFEHSSEKFVNVTNGVTLRRWVRSANQSLASFYTEKLRTSEWVVDYNLLENLRDKEEDEDFQHKWMKIKAKNKK